MIRERWGPQDKTFPNAITRNQEKPHLCHVPPFQQHCCVGALVPLQQNNVCMNFSSLLININE